MVREKFLNVKHYKTMPIYQCKFVAFIVLPTIKKTVPSMGPVPMKSCEPTPPRLGLQPQTLSLFNGIAHSLISIIIKSLISVQPVDSQ